MPLKTLLVVASLALAAGVPLPTVQAMAAPVRTDAKSPQAMLVAEVARLAGQTDGTVGFAIRKVGSKETLTYNKGTTFPMASTFKIAVAGRIFERIDKGELRLDQMVEVDPRLVVNSDGIARFAPHPGVSLSLHNQLELMLTRSDNTATDVLTALAGGPAAVTDWIRRQGVTGQRVDADTAHLIYRALDIEPGKGTFKETIEAAYAADPRKRERDIQRTPNAAFNADPRDASTPEAMVDLLLAIESGKTLSAASTREFLAIMERCITGEKRLKGLLPTGTVVAHKTGTLMSIANDVGLVTLPDGQKFAIAVFVKGDTKGVDTQERIIAELARTAFGYYVLGGR